MTQEHQVKPWLFHLFSNGRDIEFHRVPAASDPSKRRDGRVAVPWALQGERDPNSPEWKVLIFVRADVSDKEIMDEINKAQTYWREQTERIQ